MRTSPLIITSGFSKFRYTVSNDSGRRHGELRLRTLPSDPITLSFDDRNYRIDAERISDRMINNDFRFTLVDSDGTTLATADKLQGRRAFAVDIAGVAARFEHRGNPFSLDYALLDAQGASVGRLRDITGFTLWSRKFRFDRDTEIEGPVGVFLFFLAINLYFR